MGIGLGIVITPRHLRRGDVAPPPAPDPRLSGPADLAYSLVTDAATGQVHFTVTAPAALAGPFQASLADLAGGPVCLAVPVIDGPAKAGGTLSRQRGGLWAHDQRGGDAVITAAWQRDGVAIAGQTGGTYTTSNADIDHAIRYAETATQGAGSRSAASGAVTIIPAVTPRDSFTTATATSLASYVGELGMGWSGDQLDRFVVSDGRLWAATTSSVTYALRADAVGPDQYAEARVATGDGSQSVKGLGLVVRGDSTGQGYFAIFNGFAWLVYAQTTAALTLVGRWAGPRDVEAEVRLEARGSTIRLLFDGAVVVEGTNTSLTQGKIGVRGFNNLPADPRMVHLLDFGGGTLAV